MGDIGTVLSNFSSLKYSVNLWLSAVRAFAALLLPFVMLVMPLQDLNGLDLERTPFFFNGFGDSFSVLGSIAAIILEQKTINYTVQSRVKWIWMTILFWANMVGLLSLYISHFSQTSYSS